MPEAEIDFRAGGVFAVCMRMPTGEDHWMKERSTRSSAPDRLAFTAGVTFGGEKRFTVQTIVTFEDDRAGTRMTVRQAYDIHDPAFLFAVDGAAEGWRMTLDKLEREVARIEAEAPRSVVHAIFSLSGLRRLPCARAFAPSPTRRRRRAGSRVAAGGRRSSARWTYVPGSRTRQGTMAERLGHDVRCRLLRRRAEPAARLLLRDAPRCPQDFGLARDH